MIIKDNEPRIIWITEHGKQNKHVGVCYNIYYKAAMSGEFKLERWLTTEMIAKFDNKVNTAVKLFATEEVNSIDGIIAVLMTTENGQNVIAECLTGDLMSFRCQMGTQGHLTLLTMIEIM